MSQKFLFFNVQGMTCRSCEHALETLTQQVPGVTAASANHAWNLLSVAYETAHADQKSILVKKILQEVDAFELKPTDNPFQPEENTTKKNHYFFYALLNALLTLASHFAESFLPAPISIGAKIFDLLVSSVVLGCMVATGRELFHDAYVNLKQKRSNMNTLVALSTITAWILSIVCIVFPSLFVNFFHFMPIFMILGIVNLGRGIKERAQNRVKQLTKSFDSLFLENQPQTALRVKPEKNGIERIPYLAIQPGDILEVELGQRFPTDGKLLSNEAWVNQKNLTGESFLVLKKSNDLVFAGTLNTYNKVRIQAISKGQDSALMKLLWKVREGQMERAKSYQWVDKIAQKFVPFVIGLSIISGLGWLIFAGSPLLAFNTIVSVLLGACPCALGIASQISSSLALYKMLNLGIFIKNADCLKMLTRLDTLVFDKTGTLTEPVVQAKFFSNPLEAEDAVQWAASLEKSFSSHPIAVAIIKANKRGLCEIQEAKNHSSAQGIIGKIKNKQVVVGSLALLQNENCVISPDIRLESEKFQATGFTPIFISIEGKCQGVLGLKHQLKSGVASTLRYLKRQGFKLILLTGDHAEVTKVFAKDLPFDQVYSEKSAQQKKDIIQGLVKTKHKVGFIGDGLNDMEATDAAHMGIAIQSWTHLASKAHLCLKGSIRELPKSIQLAALVQTNIKQNLAWTFFYNTLSLLVASGVFYPLIGFSLNPVIFAAMMGISSLIVIANSLRVPALVDKHLENTFKSSYEASFAPSNKIYPAVKVKEVCEPKKPIVYSKQRDEGNNFENPSVMQNANSTFSFK